MMDRNRIVSYKGSFVEATMVRRTHRPDRKKNGGAENVRAHPLDMNSTGQAEVMKFVAVAKLMKRFSAFTW